MEKKLKQLLDYQKFFCDDDLQKVIDRCENPASASGETDVSPGDIAGTDGKQKGKMLRLHPYKRSAFTMAGSVAAAVLVLVVNAALVTPGGEGTVQPGVGSLFAGGSVGVVTAGILLLLGIAAAIVFYRQDKKTGNGRKKD